MTKESDISHPNDPSGKLSMDEQLLLDIRKVIEDNLKNEQFSVEDLADSIALSRSHLHRKLQKLTGRSISQFIRSIRLEQAMDLLVREVATVSEIAYQVGFGSPTYFIKCFHEEFGYPPGEAKRRIVEMPPEEKDQVEKDPSPSSIDTSASIETLHPAKSEVLIRELFEELVKFKPSLEKFLMYDEDEGETLDIRLLAYQIIKNYPWPIGVELRRLFSGALLKADPKRKEQLQKSIGRNTKMLTFLIINELIRVLETKKMVLGAEVKMTIRNAIERPNPKHMVWLLVNVKEQLSANKINLFIPELSVALDEGLFRELNAWLETIEKDSDLDSIEEECMNLEQILISLLKKSAFLVKYKLVNIGSIVVNKPKFKQASFEHTIHLLNSTDSEFRIHREVLEKYSDSNAVLLMKSIKDPDQFLNLSPLMIDTHNEVSHQSERIPIKKDIYFFNGLVEDNMEYIGTELTQPVDLSRLPKYDLLKEELQELLNLISA